MPAKFAKKRDIEKLRKQFAELSIHVEPPLEFDQDTGTLIYQGDDAGDWRITMPLGGGDYSAQEIYAAPGGGWVDGPRTATLHEMNDRDDVGIINVSARRRRNNQWVFSAPC